MSHRLECKSLISGSPPVCCYASALHSNKTLQSIEISCLCSYVFNANTLDHLGFGAELCQLAKARGRRMQEALGDGGASVICTRRCKSTEPLSDQSWKLQTLTPEVMKPRWLPQLAHSPDSALNKSTFYLLVQELDLRGVWERGCEDE